MDSDSYNIEYFRNIGCKFIEIESNFETMSSLLNQYKVKQAFLPIDFVKEATNHLNSIIKTSNTVDNLYVKVFLSCIVPHAESKLFDKNPEALKLIESVLGNKSHQNEIMGALKQADTTDKLIHLVIEFFKDKFIDPDRYFRLISILCINYKGLKFSEIQSIISIDSNILTAICLIFKPFFLHHKGYWKITNPSFVKLYYQNYLKNNSAKRSLHLKIANALDKEEDSIRKLEEQTNNLYHSEDYFSLKQKISSIDNFIVLFSENTKFELFRFWKRLEKKGYDPVYEYNKAFEIFEMHYNPKDNELFILSIQICRFFKELSEFESNITPEFRHPFIKSKIVQNVETIEYRYRPKTETKRLNRFEDRLPASRYFKTCKGLLETNLWENYVSYPPIFDSAEEVDWAFEKTNEDNDQDSQSVNYLDEIGILQELKLLGLYGTSQCILKEHETLNIEIPLNRDKFIGYFEDKLHEKARLRTKNNKNTESYEFEIEDYQENIIASNEMLLLQEKDNHVDEYTKIIMNIDLTIEPQGNKLFYYYKRWLWMNFPLICLSKEKTNFSDLMAYCYSDSKSSLDYEQDRSIYLNCLLIINQLKENKKAILKNKTVLNPLTKSTIMKKSYVMKSSGKLDSSKQKFKSDANLIPKSVFSQRRETQLKAALQIKNNTEYEHFEDSLQKSVHMQNSLLKSNLVDMNKKIFDNNDTKSNTRAYGHKIDNLSEILDQWGSKELSLLTKKRDGIIADYNKVMFNKDELLKKIDKLENIKKHKMVNKETKQLKKQSSEAMFYTVKTKDMKLKLGEVIEQKKRYQQIIDVCSLNKIQNEDWIRSLTFYYNNLKTISTDKQRELDEKENNLVEIKLKSREIYEKYQLSKEKRELFVNNFTKYLDQKKQIDKAIIHCKLKSKYKNKE